MRTLLLHPVENVLRDLGSYLPGVTLATRHPGGQWDILIRWGCTDGPDAPFTYNATWALENASSVRGRYGLLRLNGLPLVRPNAAQQTASRNAARYRVHMVDLEAVAIRRASRRGSREVPAADQRRREFLSGLARRALYALGLHFGAVDIEVVSGRPRVRRVDPAPQLDHDLLSSYGQRLASAVQKLIADATAPPSERAKKILLGADPEFIVVRRYDRSLRYASDLFPQYGSVGFDRQSRMVGGLRRHPIAEVRPSPSPSPYDLVTHLHQELARAYRMIPDQTSDWLAGSHPVPDCFTGGHVHFSGTQPTTFLLRTLDNYLALPAFLLEDAAGARARRPRYGRLGDIRCKTHGGFEYRTLGSWLTSQRRAQVTLCLAKVAAVEYPRLRRHLLGRFSDQEAFYNGVKAMFRGQIEALWEDLAATDLYQEYSQDLERTRIWILNRRQWREHVDLKRFWRIG